MAKILMLVGFLTLIYASLSISGAAVIRPINEAHRSATLELFVPINGSFGSLEETYEALRTFQILGVEKSAEISYATCPVAGSSEILQNLDLSRDITLSLSANHLQKLRLFFQLITPLGHNFKPHQVFLKLRHENNVEHIFIMESSSRQFKITLDFLALVERFYYLSGKYKIKLTVGDAAMENSFLRSLGHIELDLPEPPEKAARPPPQPVDPYLRFGPK